MLYLASIITTHYGSQGIEMLIKLKKTFCELLKYLDIHYYNSINTI